MIKTVRISTTANVNILLMQLQITQELQPLKSVQIRFDSWLGYVGSELAHKGPRFDICPGHFSYNLAIKIYS